MEKENIKVSRKIELFPDEGQIKILNKFFGAHRYFYNKAIDNYWDLGDEKAKHEAIRNLILPNHVNLKESDKEYWVKSVPSNTCDRAIKDFAAAKKGFYTKLAKYNAVGRGSNLYFDPKFKSKKDPNQMFWVKCSEIEFENGELKLCSRRIKSRIKLSKTSKNKRKKNRTRTNFKITSDSIIQKSDNRYFLISFTEIKNQHIKKNCNNDNILAIDPGVRTFATCYDGENILEFGKDLAKDLLEPKLKRVDKIKSFIESNKIKSKKKRKLERRQSLLRTKVKNIVSNFHWKTAKYMTDNYKVILLPELNVSNIIRKKENKTKELPKIVKRSLLALSHFKFRQKIKHIVDQKTKCDLLLCREDYTSKTCGSCGELNEVGSSKEYKCIKCNYLADRDHNAARNIYIRSLTKLVEE